MTLASKSLLSQPRAAAHTADVFGLHTLYVWVAYSVHLDAVEHVESGASALIWSFLEVFDLQLATLLHRTMHRIAYVRSCGSMPCCSVLNILCFCWLIVLIVYCTAALQCVLHNQSLSLHDSLMV